MVVGALSAFGLQGANAMELSSDMTLGEFTDDGAGLLIGPGFTFDAEGGELNVTGTLSGDNAIECTGNGAPFYFGLQNEGRLENADSITADTIINTGELTVNEITLTKTGVDAYFMNIKLDGDDAAHVVVNGSIKLDRAGWVNNTDGAVMDLNGQDAVIGAELANDYGAVLNINADTTFERSLWNVEGAVMNIADGVTITTASGFANGFRTNRGGTVNAGGATIIVNGSNSTFSNLGTAEIGFVGVESPYYMTAFNEGDLTITQGFEATLSNSGTLRWEAENAFEGDLNNTGTVYAPSGSFKVDGNFRMQRQNARIRTSEEEVLRSLFVTGNVNVDLSTLEVTENIEAGAISVGYYDHDGRGVTDRMTLKSGLFVYNATDGRSTSVEVNDLIPQNADGLGSRIGANGSGTGQHGFASLIVHNSIVLEDGHILENFGSILLDGEESLISGNGTILNTVDEGSREEAVGLIAKDASKAKIANLTIEGTLVNEGEVYAETLTVTTGSDGIAGASSRAFAVDNLVVQAGGDFSLLSEETSLANVVVSEEAKLNGSQTTLILSEEGSIRNAGNVLVGALEADGSQITNAANSTMTIGILDGAGNTIRMEDGAQAQVTLGENRDSTLTALFSGEAADRHTVEELAGAIVITAPDDSYGYTLQSEEGLVAGAREAEVDANGNVIRQTERANTVASGILDLVGSNFLFFRGAMNDV